MPPPWFGKGPHHGSSRRKTKNKHFSQFLQQINTLCKLFSLHVKKYLSHYYFTIQSNPMQCMMKYKFLYLVDTALYIVVLYSIQSLSLRLPRLFAGKLEVQLLR